MRINQEFLLLLQTIVMIIKGVMKGCCPKCGQGKIFETKGSILKLQVPKMNEYCSQCAYRFARESGYFVGAMYVSYGLAILEMLTLFLLIFQFVSLTVLFFALFGLLLLLMFFNFRMSRVIWIHIFHQ